MKRALVAVISVLTLFLVLVTGLRMARAETTTPITIIAHRCNGTSAGSIYTENTQMSCVKAAATGATWLDADIRWTSTNLPVLLHDPDLHLFGAPGLMINSVSTTVARQHLSPAPAINQPTTLTQFRDTMLATHTNGSVEPKINPTETQWGQLDTAFAGIKDRVLLNSFDPAVLLEATAHGYTTALNTTDDPASVPAGTHIVIEQAVNIDAGTLAALAEQGVAMWCGCDTPAVWAAMVALGVSGFATDDHEGAQAWVDANT